MPATIIRADYDGLKRIAQLFTSSADEASGMTRNLASQTDVLRGGDWIGPGAKAFYAEMDASVMPSLKRLTAALTEGARTANEIVRIAKQA